MKMQQNDGWDLRIMSDEIRVKKDKFIAKARQFGIALDPFDIDTDQDGDLMIDGMTAEVWLSAMTKE